MKIKHLFLIILLAIGFPVFAENNVFNFSIPTESIIAGSGVALYGTYFFCDKILKMDKSLPAEGTIFSKDAVNPFDRIFMNPYNKKIDTLSTFVGAGVVASAGILAFAPMNQWITIGSMYAETLLWAYSLKCIGKLAVGKTRPYMYFDNIPEEAYSEFDWNDSFPSAHSTFVFAAATFTSYVYCKYFPESAWRYAVIGGTYSVAALTAAMRILSGNHFLTDVLAGALIGSVCGFVIPFVHTLSFGKPLNLSLGKLGTASVNFIPMGVSEFGILFNVGI